MGVSSHAYTSPQKCHPNKQVYCDFLKRRGKGSGVYLPMTWKKQAKRITARNRNRIPSSIFFIIFKILLPIVASFKYGKWRHVPGEKSLSPRDKQSIMSYVSAACFYGSCKFLHNISTYAVIICLFNRICIAQDFKSIAFLRSKGVNLHTLFSQLGNVTLIICCQLLIAFFGCCSNHFLKIFWSSAESVFHNSELNITIAGLQL